jgi:hypothetical protein
MNKKKLLAALLAALAAFVGVLTETTTDVPQAAAPPAFGWVNDPPAVQAVAAGLPVPRFADTPAFREDAGPADVFLWDACRKVTGDLLPPRDQGRVGACVGFGTAAAVEHLICVQAASGSGSREEFRELAPEAIYAGSRVEIGGGRVAGDGSVGAWAAKFVSEYGVVPRAKYGPLDLTRYDEPTCRRLGALGLPADVEAVAKKYPVKAVANVRSWAECRAAIRNGYPVAVCSGQGFRMARDSDGYGVPQGTWMHCMAVTGVCGGNRPGGFVLNSWGGAAHPGPLGPGKPSPAGFWVDAAVLDRMLAAGDSWAFSGFAGFPARKLDWYAAVRNGGPPA